ncbi:MarR family transcriptional regulator [Tsukamurella sp. 8F]|uniref:MarR family winged helix-turn-helix transcriptional regulator n=1 Tax=unclassified Tsukamurella TaxID=2633480 RepID=UPI0023B9F686|nr:MULTISPECIES: MarR family transcriptional regulator [unclassified Tsukamurella]MDF0531934.1 MarR family transcriptional regulator [Tsukamurella sp. 8J]MDF0588015.1 MarR family transcriptional regulator [Tsukamurella sp. 8F]
MSQTTRASADETLAAQWHVLLRDFSRLNCALDRALGEHKLSASEFEVLEQLAQEPVDGLRMADLSERVHLSQSALSRLVGRLDRESLLTREICLGDRRSVIARITAEGVARYAAARPVHRAVLRAEASRSPIGSYLNGVR